jgi:hypothetical protein
VVALVGCRGPDKANIELRKENQALKEQIEKQGRRHQADLAQIAALQAEKGSAVQTLPATRMAELFTVTAVDINKLTGFRKDGLKVYVSPTDEAGDVIKAAGSVTIDAYDLAKGEQAHLGHWEFPLKDAASNWYQSWIVHGYALQTPLQPPESAKEITVRASYTDALTQRTFTDQRVIRTTVIAAESR